MRRLVRSLLLPGSAILAAVLLAGTAVFVSPAQAASCANIAPALDVRVAHADVIVIGTVQDVSGMTAAVVPEAFLRGPARAEPLTLQQPSEQPECPLAELSAGERVLLMLNASGGAFAWPDYSLAYVLKGGQARLATDQISDDRTEAQLVSDIRSMTNLYAVPAQQPGEGASIDWVKTVIPVTAVLVVVFAIGLVLMRTWHRIDPS